MAEKIKVEFERFERAIERAVDNDFEDRIHYRWTYNEAGFTEMGFNADSATRPELGYNIRLTLDAGALTTSCNCDAGQHGNHPCWHVAGALLMAGFLAEPDGPCEGCGRTVWAGTNGDYDRDAGIAVCDDCQEREAAEIQAEIDAARDAEYLHGVSFDDDLGYAPF